MRLKSSKSTVRLGSAPREPHNVAVLVAWTGPCGEGARQVQPATGISDVQRQKLASELRLLFRQALPEFVLRQRAMLEAAFRKDRNVHVRDRFDPAGHDLAFERV